MGNTFKACIGEEEAYQPKPTTKRSANTGANSTTATNADAGKKNVEAVDSGKKKETTTAKDSTTSGTDKGVVVDAKPKEDVKVEKAPVNGSSEAQPGAKKEASQAANVVEFKPEVAVCKGDKGAAKSVEAAKADVKKDQAVASGAAAVSDTKIETASKPAAKETAQESNSSEASKSAEPVAQAAAPPAAPSTETTKKKKNRKKKKKSKK
eukprot:CAMPEP_0203797260 /NCGR_PEP_ID=MMETSP0100_2-20121128/8517_1 /ASSEMBLY_ACC=CAM_ASM_000210 /TAXON_ID=96639 /ORGANISM=" , Strain NY0313808BC1" /LENGTH=208 /DNA_ID=CAMNT_0050702521 /DNA_START=21 /DNA_END=647 /DNA_ORIENTATION=-